jgi:hypothetical protein
MFLILSIKSIEFFIDALSNFCSELYFIILYWNAGEKGFNIKRDQTVFTVQIYVLNFIY